MIKKLLNDIDFKPMTQLSKMADKILKQREDVENERKEKEQAEYKSRIKYYLNEFKIGFKDELPILKEAGIKYSAHFRDIRYEHMGVYILLKKGKREIRMEFSSRTSYRYEYIPNGPHYGTHCFGNWPKEDFIVFVDKGLLK